jgi:hypothetical protein
VDDGEAPKLDRQCPGARPGKSSSKERTLPRQIVDSGLGVAARKESAADRLEAQAAKFRADAAALRAAYAERQKQAAS